MSSNYSWVFISLHFCCKSVELSDLWPTVFPDTQGLKNKQKIGQLRSPPTAFPFPGLSLAVRLNPLVRSHRPLLKRGLKLIWSVSCYRPPSLSLFAQTLFVLQNLGQDTRTLPTRKGPIQILNLWGSPLELYLGELRIFNPDKEQEQVFPEIPCMALYGHSTLTIVRAQ